MIGFDNVVVGTSPMALMEAVFRFTEGERVAILERNSFSGGAWASMTWEDFEKVDTGCHIIEPDPPSYKFLTEVLGCQLARQEPQPFFIYDERRYRCGSALPKRKKQFREKASLGNLIRLLQAQATEAFSEKHLYFYPEKGSSEMMTQLLDLIHRAEIPIFHNEELVSVEISNQKGFCQLRTNQRKIEAKRLTMTNAAQIEEIRDERGSLELSADLSRSHFYHLHVLIESDEPTRFSYIKFLDHDFLNRACDITAYARPIRDRQRLLCLQLHKDMEAGGVDAILDDLIRQRLLEREIRCLKSRWSVYKNTSFARHKDEMENIERRFKPFVRVLKTKALAPNMNEYVESWNKIKSFNFSHQEARQA